MLRTYGDERFATRIARAIVAARPLTTTTELAEVVRDAIPAAARRTGGHPAKRTFQAVRIEVNEELSILADSIDQAIDFLAPGGRCAVLAYHSGEDRIVKERFRHHVTGGVEPVPGLPLPDRRRADGPPRPWHPEDAPRPRSWPPTPVPRAPASASSRSSPGGPADDCPVRRRRARRPAAGDRLRRPPRPVAAPTSRPHLRSCVRPPSPRRRLRTGPTFALGVSLAFAIAFAVVACQVLLVQGQERLDDRPRRHRRADRPPTSELRLEVAELEAPARIVAAATELGMVAAPGGRCT